MQHLVGQDEPPLLVVEGAQRIDVDLARLRVHGGDLDAVRAGEFGVGDERDAGREGAEQRVGGDEPAQGPLPGTPGGRRAVQGVAPAARHVHRGGHGAGQGGGERRLPVGRPPGVPAPRNEHLVGFPACGAAVLVGGRESGAPPAGGELLLVAAGVRRRKVVGGGADAEGQQKPVDDRAARGAFVPVRLVAPVRGGGEVSEAEVEGGVRERPGPAGGFDDAGGVRVQGGSGPRARAACRAGSRSPTALKGVGGPPPDPGTVRTPVPGRTFRCRGRPRGTPVARWRARAGVRGHGRA